MRYCSHCGTKIEDDNIEICDNCGCYVCEQRRTDEQTRIDSREYERRSYYDFDRYMDEPNVWLNVLGFFFPILGLVLFCSMYTRTPRKASSIGLYSLIGVLVAVVLGIILWFIILSDISRSYYLYQY